MVQLGDSVSTSLGVLIAVALVVSGGVFARALREERAQVRNRGVNQAAIVTWARAGRQAAAVVLKYGAFLYLFATFYAYFMFQRTCARDDWTRAAYERGTLVEHVTEALRWPLYLEGDPPCGARLLAPVQSAE